MTDKTIRDAGEAFESAIRAGVLSDNPHSPKRAGCFMYMYTEANRDYFKHIQTRNYITAPITAE